MQTLNIASDFINFLKPSKTQFHAIQECVRRLEDHHFVRLHEREDWKGKINNGGLYYFTRNQTSLFAFAVGNDYQPGNGYSITAAHSDSPYLKLKPMSAINNNGLVQCGVEVYDSAIWPTWLDRDLGLAGRVLV